MPAATIREHRRRRYRRRQASSEWLIGSSRVAAGQPYDAREGDGTWVRPPRTARCRWRVAEQVGVHHDESGRSAHWSGLERCASIWSCPVCSAVIRAERALEVQAAVDAWRERGGHTVMATLTVRHRLRDPLAVGLDAVIRGWQRLLAQKAWRLIKADLGVRGFVRSIEITWTEENGWHPHAHVLLFCERPLTPSQVLELEDRLFAAWERIVVKLGARQPLRAHGVRVTRGAAEYVAKVQEHDRAGVEMTRFDLKRSRSAAGWMPFELLDVEGTDRARARRLWVEYWTATLGRRALTWSRGLRDLLGVNEERTDDQIIDDAERAPAVMLISAEAYDTRLRDKPGRMSATLDLVEAGDLHLAARTAGAHAVLDPPPPEGRARSAEREDADLTMVGR